ncbi:MAG: efflux RND transporter periplasmic adaptor subunit [Bacteroidetes bacterium]|nr:efflux RND transporter periplasmic adaptor subunit [Bacteroidota bacterium]
MKIHILILFSVLLFSCKSKVEKTKPTQESISESIYASGIIKSKNQYQVFASANGIVDQVFVSEGDTVKKGEALLSIVSDAQKINQENAELASNFSDFNANEGKLYEAKLFVDLAKSKLQNDSMLYIRQKNLWQQQIGSKVELEQRELAYQNAKTSYISAQVKYGDLRRQLAFTSSQSKKNLLLSTKLLNDNTVKSEINGIVYSLTKSKGEIVGVQSPVAIIGDATNFILEMQVDEYDILKIRKGQIVMVTLDSYKDQVFEAKVTKINPIMNERSKTFLIEAEFIQQPEILYPNITFEANIVMQTKDKALLIPRAYMLNDSTVIKSNGDEVRVKTGLKDYQKIEILSGLSVEDELQKPKI